MPDPETRPPPPSRVAVLGGTGKLGGGLARRWAAAGVAVTVGSRDADRARARATEIGSDLPRDAAAVTGATNPDAIAGADLVVLAVPFDGAAALVADLADALAGALVVSAVNPLGFDRLGPYPGEVDGAGSAAELLAAAAPDARWTAALHSVSSVTLSDLDAPLEDDVLVVGDDDGDVDRAVAAIAALGVRALPAGPLRLAGTLEAFTAVLISVNKRHRAHAGVRLSGLPGR